MSSNYDSYDRSIPIAIENPTNSTAHVGIKQSISDVKHKK